MAFPSSTGSQALTLALALQTAQNMAGAVKVRAQSLSISCAAGNVPAQTILDGVSALADAKVTFNKCSATVGLAAYAQAQVGDANIATEFTTMVSAIDGVNNWVLANFPKDSTNTFLMITSFTPDNTGKITQRTFSTAQLAPLKTLLDALVASID